MEILAKQQVLTRFILNGVLEDISKIKKELISSPSAKSEFRSLFVTFEHFPINSLEALGLLENHLSEREHFKAAVVEMSKRGGKTPYDFMKRCLTSIFTNEFASQFSWLGAKKKRVFGQLKVAELLLEAAQVNGVSKDRKSSEEAIKAWLRRAKERHISAMKKLLPPDHNIMPLV